MDDRDLLALLLQRERRRLALSRVLRLAFLPALLLACFGVAIPAARAGGFDPLLRTQVLKILDDLDIINAGAYTAPSSATGWTRTSGQVATTTATDGVLVGGGALGAAELLDLTGDETRDTVDIELGVSTSGLFRVFADGGAGAIALAANDVEISSTGDLTLSGTMSLAGQVAPGTDDTLDLGDATNGWRRLFIGGAGALLDSGTATPEGSVSAPVGSIFTNSSGGVDSTLYVKESGSGNTGWRPFTLPIDALVGTDQASGTSITYTVPGGTLGTDGDALIYIAGGTLAGNVESVRVRFGGSTILDGSAVSFNSNADWYSWGIIRRTGAATQSSCTVATSGTSASVEDPRTTTAITLSNDADLVVDYSTANNASRAVKFLWAVKVDAP